MGADLNKERRIIAREVNAAIDEATAEATYFDTLIGNMYDKINFIDILTAYLSPQDRREEGK